MKGKRLSSKRTECIRRDRPASYAPPGSGGTQDPANLSQYGCGRIPAEARTHVWAGGVALEVGLNRLVLLVEQGQVRDQVLDDVGVREGIDAGLLGGLSRDTAWLTLVCAFQSRLCSTSARHTQASQSVNAINVHSTATTDTLTARSAEGQGRVKLVLYPDESVQHHGACLVQVELVALHRGLLGRCVRVPTVDLEGLHIGRLRDVRIDGLGRLDSRVRASEGGGPEQRPGCREQSRGVAKRGHSGRGGDTMLTAV